MSENKKVLNTYNNRVRLCLQKNANSIKISDPLTYEIYYEKFFNLFYKWVNDIFIIMYISCKYEHNLSLLKNDQEWIKNYVYIIIHKFYLKNKDKKIENLYEGFVETYLIITSSYWILEYWMIDEDLCRSISSYEILSPLGFTKNEIKNKAYEILKLIDYSLHSISLLNLNDTIYIKQIVSKINNDNF